MNRHLKSMLAAGALVLVANPALAVVDHYLAAKAYTKVLPDNSSVPMWGYVEDTGDGTQTHCYDYTGGGSAALRWTCVNALPDPVVGGPWLKAGPNDPDFRIFLTNGLPEPTSIVVPGQELPWSANNNGPTWDDGSTGARGTDLSKRVRSYGREAAANGGRMSYRWTNFRQNPFDRPGTFLYHSGTHPQKQVYMGLYGAITKDATAGSPAEAYPGVVYDNEVMLFYSEIDPDLNRSIDDGSYITSIDYRARWFLVNGEPYVQGSTLDIPAGAAGERTLLRMVSAAGETHVPVLQGLYMTIHAEDGLQYNWQDGATGVSTPAPRQQYSAMLPPLKTKDAIVTASVPGRYAVYDGNGYMTNPSDPADFGVGDTVGGMLRFLAFDAGANQPPVAIADTATTGQGLAVSIDVLANDSDPEGDTLGITIVTQGTNGGVTTDSATVTYTPNVGFFGTDGFTYDIDDGNGNTATGTVAVTVSRANQAPVANSDTATVDQNLAVIVNVLANDTDGNGDTLTITTVTQGTNGVVTTDGSTVIYTPALNFTGSDGFTYTVDDGFGGNAIGNVTVTVNATGNNPPVANADAYEVNEDAILDVAAPGILSNDTDVDADMLTAVLDSVPTHPRLDAPNGGFTLNPDGSFHYEPDVNYFGPDAFTYHANDGTDNSGVVIVTLTVNSQNDAPIAVADTIFLTKMGTITIPVPGVLGNDNDVDSIPFDPAQLTAVQDTSPNRGTLNAFNPDGSFTYTFNGGRVGNVASFDYHNNDGLANSNTVTVTLRRVLSVKTAECEFDAQTNTCTWVIAGRVTNDVPNNTSTIEAWLGPFGSGTLIGTHVEKGGAAWSMQIGSSTTVPNPGDVLNVRAVVTSTGASIPNALNTDFPVVIK